jgi:hypothetical protein
MDALSTQSGQVPANPARCPMVAATGDPGGQVAPA